MKLIILSLVCVAFTSCGKGVNNPTVDGTDGSNGVNGVTGTTGASGLSCSIAQTKLGVVIKCPDGTSGVVLHCNRKCSNHD